MPSAIRIVLVAFSEALGVAHEFADKHGYDIEADQELTAHGVTNLVSGLLGGMVAAGGMSGSAVKEGAGARSQIANLVAWAATIVTVLLLTPLFKTLPEAVLAALIIHALWHILVARKLQAIRTVSRTELWLGHLSVLGRMPDVPGKYADVARHPEAVRVPGILVVRFDAPIYYANALSIRGRIEELIQADDVPPRAVVLDASVQDSLDLTSAEMLAKLVAKLKQAGTEVAVAEVHAPVLAFARTSGLLAVVGADSVYPTVDAAVHAVSGSETPFPPVVRTTTAPR